MRLDCKFTEQIIADFDRLWSCKQEGETLEISTPYRMPDSTLFTLFLTERKERFIACDGGRIWELIQQYPDLEKSDALEELRSLAKANGMKEGRGFENETLFFKDCSEEKLISSIAFDVANFATMATSVLTALVPEETQDRTDSIHFTTKAADFIRGILRSGETLTTNQEIQGVSDVRWSALIQSSSGVTVVSCISGRTPSNFRKNISDAAYSFKELWESPMARNGHLKLALPLLNSDTSAYQPRRLEHRLMELKKEARQTPISWAENYQIDRLIHAN